MNKYYIDEFYDASISKPVIKASSTIYRYLEQNLFERIVNGVGTLVLLSSRTVRFIQTGSVGLYIFVMVISILVILAINSFLYGV
jgi:NADH-quinone oxidoreductase subunit L